MSPEWVFADPPNVATYTTRKVLDDGHPILLVTHDEDDGAWQFLCGTTNEAADARIVGLDTIVQKDPSVIELADLPLGWRAWRDSPRGPWHRAPRA